MSGTPLSRRGLLRVTALGGAAGVVVAGALSGCDLDLGSSSTPRAVPSPDPDQQIVDAARAELRGLIARLSGVTGTRELVACHRRQLEALQGELPTTTRAGLTRAQVVARERRAADRFAHWAAVCQNGDLARVLAAVAAGIRMQPVLRPTGRTSGGPS